MVVNVVNVNDDQEIAAAAIKQSPHSFSSPPHSFADNNQQQQQHFTPHSRPPITTVTCRLAHLLTFASILFLVGCILLLLLMVVALMNGAAAGKGMGNGSIMEEEQSTNVAADDQSMQKKKKILIIQPHQSFTLSHFSFTVNLAHVLVEAGHQVHLLVPLFKEEEKLNDAELERKFNVVYYLASKELQEEKAEIWRQFPGPGLARTRQEWKQQEQQQQKQQQMVPSSPSSSNNNNNNGQPDGPTMRPPHILAKITGKIYQEIANNLEFMDGLQAKKFDIGIAEAFLGNEWGLALFRLLGVPRTVFTSAMAPVPEFYYYLGLLGKIKEANVPFLRGTKIGDHRKEQRQERAEEIWKATLDNVIQPLSNSVETEIAFQNIAEQHYGFVEFPTLLELYKQTDTYLTNTQPEMDFADSTNAIQKSPASKKIGYVGGVNALRARQTENGTSLAIEPEIMKRAEQHAGGIVLFGLGTVLNTSKELGDEQVEAIRQAMAQFPDHMFIWTFTRDDPRIAELNEQKIANIYATGWVNQPALLAHPSMKAFISHCGMNSALEACWNGVPLVCTPWMGDQFYNAEALASKGVAVVLDLVNGFGADELANALEQVLVVKKQTSAQAKGNDAGGDVVEKPPIKIDLDEMRKLGETLRQKDLVGDILNAVIGETKLKSKK